MDKIWIVLKSEFLRRVQTKWFVIGTLIGPILLVALPVVPGILTVVAMKNNKKVVAVTDQTQVLMNRFEKLSDNQVTFVQVDDPVDSIKTAIQNGVYDGYLILPRGLERGEGSASYFSVEGGGLSTRGEIIGAVQHVVEEYRLEIENAPESLLQILRTNIPVQILKITEQGEMEDTSVAYSVMGYIMGFLMYMTMFIYGAFVMHGVLEEKSNRVVEVMISSVRPFHLLMGKVIGIGAMGLLQFAIWGVIIVAGLSFAGNIVSLFIDPASLSLPADATRDEVLRAAQFSIPTVSPLLFVWFILFFLGGYLLYASLFGAIGSAVEQQQDAQSFMLPISMLIVIPIIYMTVMIEDPNSSMSVIMSMIPFFSPILMIVRVAVTKVPIWEIAVSYLILVVTFIGSVWISSRIYRIGILMYGKKPNLKDLIRWMKYA